jgi:S1-C subfamily serine protease
VDNDDAMEGPRKDERWDDPHGEVGDDLNAEDPVTEPTVPAPPPGAWDGQAWGGSPPELPVPPTASPPPRRRALAAAVAGLLLLGAGVGIGWGVGGIHRGGSSIPLGTVPQSGSGQGLSAQAIASKVSPAVVDVNTAIDAFGAGGQPRGEAAGTGVLLTSSGEVLTNNHVIVGATSIRVTIQGYGSHTATVIGADPSDDVALLQVGGVSGLPAATLADSSRLTVGQRVVAIGNALGRGGPPAVTEGSISALGRSLTVDGRNGRAENLSDLIQTDAPISPGDSGGPLVNESGQVVGIITAAAAASPFQGVSSEGFAIPVNAAVDIVNEIRAGHATSDIIIGQTGFMGVQVRNLDAQTASQLGLGVTSGALVVGVVPGTPAADAGIPTDAVITAVDGQQIASADELGPVIYTHKPGQRIAVTWVDRNGTHTATISLIIGPAV